MPIMMNPLRYPGAKRSLAAYIGTLIRANNLDDCCFIEPYAGSAAVGLDLLQKGAISTLMLCEKDILIYAFWECAFNHTYELCEMIDLTPVTLQTWNHISAYRHVKGIKEEALLNLGYAGLFLNRTNFSGILNANPIGGKAQASKYDITCRFNKQKIIDMIYGLSKYSERVTVFFDDAIHFLRSQQSRFIQENCFAYLDPPYYEKGPQIYRHYYTDEDHTLLSKYVREVKHLDWLISYDDSPYINNLYSSSGAQYQPFFLDYSCASKVRKNGKELLISNLPLPPISISQAHNM